MGIKILIIDHVEDNFPQVSMSRLFYQGKILKSEIKRHGLRLNFVAEKSGIAHSTFDSYVNDRQGIPESILKGILHTFPVLDKKLFKFEEPGQQRIPLNRKGKGAANG